MKKYKLIMIKIGILFLFTCVLISSFYELSASMADKSCIGGSYQETHPQVGRSCWCASAGYWVTSQECIDGGNGCSTIYCAQN